MLPVVWASEVFANQKALFAICDVGLSQLVLVGRTYSLTAKHLLHSIEINVKTK